METTNIINTILNFIGCVAWKIYVKAKWRRNIIVKEILLKEEIRDNLGYYLSNGHPDFAIYKIK